MKRLNSIKMLTYFIAFIGFISFFSCSSKDDIKKNVAKMEATPVVIDMGKMSTWIPDNNKYVSCELGKKLTLVVYADSTQCTSCFINRLKEWNEMLKLEKDEKHSIMFLFIMEPRSGESQDLCEILNETGFNHPVLIDDKYIFRKSNPQIPQDALYHTFLLDKDKKVILVGNPLRSEKIEKLFYKRLKQE